MHKDFIRTAGLPFLAHRLKRLSDHIVAEVGMVLERQDLTVPPTAGSTLLLLSEHERLGVVDIAERLRFTHPFIVRLVSRLEALHLVSITNDPTDLRRKWVALTAKGTREAGVLRRLNTALEDAFQEVAAESGADLLQCVSRFEKELAATPLSTRIDERLVAGATTCALS
jgi:DNA-binding MarR family transcriptional regulator